MNGQKCCDKVMGICFHHCTKCVIYNAAILEQQRLLNTFRTQVKESLSNLPVEINEKTAEFFTGVQETLSKDIGVI